MNSVRLRFEICRGLFPPGKNNCGFRFPTRHKPDQSLLLVTPPDVLRIVAQNDLKAIEAQTFAVECDEVLAKWPHAKC